MTDKKTLKKYVQDFMTKYTKDNLKIGNLSVFSMHDQVQKVQCVLNQRYYAELSQVANVKVPEFFIDATTYIINNAIKAENIDSKDMVISTMVGDYFWESYIMRAQNRVWMDMIDFGFTVDDMTKKRIQYGGILVKKIYRSIDGVSVPDIEVMHFENSYFDIHNVKDGVKVFEMAWDDWEVMPLLTEKQKKAWHEGKNKKVLMVYGYLNKGFTEKGAKENGYDYTWQWHRIISIDGVLHVIESETMDKNIFDYLPYEPRTGFASDNRILGVGQTERAYEFQALNNVLKNAQYKMIEFSGNVYMAVDDKDAYSAIKKQNIFNLANGSFLPPSTRSLDIIPGSTVNATSNMIQSTQADLERITQSGGAMSGEIPPSGTALGTVQIVNAEARGVHDMARQRMGLFLNRIYDEHILEGQVKMLKGKESVLLDFTPDELLKIDDKMSEIEFGKALVENWGKGIRPRNEEELETMRENVKTMYYKVQKDKSNARDIILKGLRFDNLKYKFEVLVTNEQRNTQQFVEASNNIAQGLIAAQGNKEATNMLMKTADAIGINSAEIMGN